MNNLDLDKWDLRFYDVAKLVSKWSKDPTTKVGAIIVRSRRIIATGYNGIPSLIKDDSRVLEREWKLASTIHAEVNAILNAAKNGCSVDDSTIYITMFPCSNCSAAIIQSGISRVVTTDGDWPERWADNFQLSEELLYEAGVKVCYVEGL